nr:MAG TPA: hypothetical protein [Caudoviricetes sp.]
MHTTAHRMTLRSLIVLICELVQVLNLMDGGIMLH